MNNESVHLVSTHSNAATCDLLGEILRPLARLLVVSGLTQTEILQQVQQCLIDQPTGVGPRDPVHLGLGQRDCMEIMCLWRRDRRFLASDGLPAVLPITGSGATFQELCIVADVHGSAATVLETLVSFGAVSLLPDDQVRPLTPTFLLAGPDENRRIAADGVLKQIAGFMRVIDHNIAQPLDGGQRRFERACTVVVAKEILPIFEKAVRERGQEFIDALDEWLQRHLLDVSESGSYVEIGAGAYFVDLGNVERKVIKPI